jgi:hypothetical protein
MYRSSVLAGITCFLHQNSTFLLLCFQSRGLLAFPLAPGNLSA